MNPQHRPLTQELVQMAMAKTAERVALIEESERQRGLPPTTAKVASDETDESIGTDFAEKLASAVEFILPEVQAKEAGALDSVGNAIRSRAFDSAVGKGVGSGVAKKVVTGIGNLTDRQVGGGVLAAGGGLLAAGGTAAALHHGRDKQAAGRFSAAVDAVKGVAGKGKEKVMNAAGATADLLRNKKGKELAVEAKDLGSKAKARGVTANMSQVPKKWREEAASDAADLTSRAAKAKKDSTIATVKSHAAKGVLGLTGAAATGLAGKKIHDKVKEAAALPASFKANAAKMKDAFASGAGKAKDAVVDTASKGREKARAAADATGDALVKHRGKAVAAAGVAAGAGLAYGAKKIHDKVTEKKAFIAATAGGAIAGAAHGKAGRGALSAGLGGAVGAAAGNLASGGDLGAGALGEVIGGIIGYQLGMEGHRKGEKKHAEDASNPAHISGKASPLAAAPTRTEAGQPGPSPQGNTGALSSNAAAIAFSNAQNQGMKAEQLRKYFSNPASSQHGDPALGKNFAHKTASDKVAEAQHILSALAAQVEGK